MKRKPAPSPDVDCCATCVYWLEDVEPADERSGACRRYPGSVVSDDEAAYTIQPSKEPAEWCGEYKRRMQ